MGKKSQRGGKLAARDSIFFLKPVVPDLVKTQFRFPQDRHICLSSSKHNVLLFHECNALYLGGILCAGCNHQAQLADVALEAAASSKAARSKISQQWHSVTAQLSR